MPVIFSLTTKEQLPLGPNIKYVSFLVTHSFAFIRGKTTKIINCNA